MMKMEYALEQEADDSSHGTRRKKMKNKRRFSDEQIKSLESIFEEENKLEPQKKVQLARDLGLHPRQVAIWFQNKRARWKSKQLEKEYSTLRADYDALTSSFELLKEEKQCLLKQLQKLGDLIEKHPKQNRCCETGNVVVGDIDNKDAKCSEYEEKLVLDSGSDLTLIVYSEGGNGKNIEGFEHKEPELQSMGESADGSLTLPHWSDFDSGCFSDQSCSSLQWWDLWH